MAVEVADRIPSRGDARRAAAALAAAGASRVLLFGSVAQNAAVEGSDIDLVAILDDLDYNTRNIRGVELSRVAIDAADCSVDVLVTDRPEWRARTERVPTSLERHIDTTGVVLVDSEPGKVNWQKKMVLPMSDFGEAHRRMRESLDALARLSTGLTPGRDELIAMRTGDEDRRLTLLPGRLGYACGDVHLVVETSAKALIHLHPERAGPTWGHNLDKLCDQITQPHRDEVRSRLEPIGAAEINLWQQRARYGHTSGRHETATPELVETMSHAACSVASFAAARLEAAAGRPLETTRIMRLVIDDIRNLLRHYDLTTGRPQQSLQDEGFEINI